MNNILPFPVHRQVPVDMSPGVDWRGALTNAASLVACSFCAGRYDSPPVVKIAHALVRLPAGDPGRDDALTDFARALAAMCAPDWHGIDRQLRQVEALMKRQRRAERARRRRRAGT